MKPQEEQADRKRKEFQEEPEGPCTICGQLYHNFAFKGGYICENCLNSIKMPDDQNQNPDENNS